MKRFIAIISVLLTLQTIYAKDLLVESESFSHKGGWLVDQQFMDLMGSPYLLAHGMGLPVQDAYTQLDIPEDGTYHVWVRTYNWTSPWEKSAGPGKFQLIVGNQSSNTLGADGNTWFWQPAMSVSLHKGPTRITLHDLTGFEGRCDAIFLTTDNKNPNTYFSHKEDLRRNFLPIPKEESHNYDFVVIGGGIAGMCAAATAARLGLKVALINDRPVLGGNNSSEVRVHLGGIIEVGKYPALGRIIREFGHSRGGNAQPGYFYEDEKKDSFIHAESDISLFKNYRAMAVRKEGNRILSIIIENTESAKRMEIVAPLFSDCTGDGTIGALSGADYRMGREGQDEFGESMAPVSPDSLVMGASIQWYSKEDSVASSFPEFSYGIRFNQLNVERVLKGEWTWETGMNRNQITDAERIRDYGMLVVYSNWSYLKNHDEDSLFYKKHSLDWVAYVMGKRESRRLMGDYVLSQDDIDKNVFHEDASFTATWAIDLHSADSVNSLRFPGNEFKTRTVHNWIFPYAVPYRCLYSRNIDNLFMAGRDISCTHVALGTIRVMRTTGMMGEVVGMAASLCKLHGAMPRDVYRLYLGELKQLMEKGAGKANVPDNQRFNEPNETLSVPKAFLKK